jgi:hypothetical protein
LVLVEIATNHVSGIFNLQIGDVTLVGLKMDITSEIFAVVGSAFVTLGAARPFAPKGESIAIGVEAIIMTGLFT